MAHEESYGFVVVHKSTEGDRFLLVRQLTNWSFPKGHSEGDEMPVETARRELEEECGLTEISIVEGVEFCEPQYTFMRNGVKTEKVNTFFLATTESEIIHPQPIEILECRFVKADEAMNLFTYEGQKKVFAEVLEYLKLKQ
jgi:bis(5'-nucleosidyl)-tetraphosphatase